jgi:hypothetical protein
MDLSELRIKNSMNLSHKQLKIALQIDDKVHQLEQLNCTELEIFVEMSDHMPDFKQLLDTLGRDVMNQLCVRFDGFYRYARILETIAEGIASGELKVPNAETRAAIAEIEAGEGTSSRSVDELMAQLEADD